MTFKEWMNRPVYLVQCATWKRAGELNLCVYLFRAVPGQRDAKAQAARDLVARSVRIDRAKIKEQRK